MGPRSWVLHQDLTADVPAQWLACPVTSSNREKSDPAAAKHAQTDSNTLTCNGVDKSAQPSFDMGRGPHHNVQGSRHVHASEIAACQACAGNLEADADQSKTTQDLLHVLLARVGNLERHVSLKNSLDTKNTTMMDMIEKQNPSAAMLATYDTVVIAEAYSRQIEFQENLVSRLRREYAALVCGCSDLKHVNRIEATLQDCNSTEQAPSLEQNPKESSATSLENPSNAEKQAACSDAESKMDGCWMPLAVRQMPKSPAIKVDSAQTFTWEFLKLALNGEQWSPGFYFIAADSILPGRAYWVLEGDIEPCLPRKPGQHGAKLSAFFRTADPASDDEQPDESCYFNAPVFIRAPGADEYVYYGHYSQKRGRDKLDYDRIMERVPVHVRDYWARQLAQHSRPDWVTDRLTHHFCPPPKYKGEFPEPSREITRETHDSLEQYARQLAKWNSDAEPKIKQLHWVELMEAFEMADAGRGLRLWWEYFECEEFNQEFYDMLVSLRERGATTRAHGPASVRRGESSSTPGIGAIPGSANGVKSRPGKKAKNASKTGPGKDIPNNAARVLQSARSEDVANKETSGSKDSGDPKSPRHKRVFQKAMKETADWKNNKAAGKNIAGDKPNGRIAAPDSEVGAGRGDVTAASKKVLRPEPSKGRLEPMGHYVPPHRRHKNT